VKDLGKFDLKKAAIFTDIHFGKRGEVHNKDCLHFIDFLFDFVSNKENEIDHVIFMGDWFDKRDSINISTLNYSYKALSKLNSLNIPIFLLLGNHDLYLRNNRDVHSLVYFHEFNHCTLIESPTRLHIGDKSVLMMPYIFQDEYVPLSPEVNSSNVVFSHLELKGFILTGSTVVLEHGHDPEIFGKPSRVFSGHFHKRQSKGNVFYTGNPFPFDFSDTNDTDRGFAVYDYATDDLTYHNHEDSPSYIKCTLSKLLQEHKKLLKPKGVVRCLVDADISMEESIALKDRFVQKYDLREFTLEESGEDISLTGDVDLEDEKFETTDAMIRSLLEKLVVEKLNKNKLIKIYENLQ
jgi:DNA repair exonuclease SbcCD nuclease subunit